MIISSNTSNTQKLKNILFVIHSGSGGSPKTVFDLTKNIYHNYNCYMLTSDSKKMILYKFVDNTFKEIETFFLSSTWSVEKTHYNEYEDIYFKLLVKYNINLVHIHHLIYHSFDMVDVCNGLNIPLILSLHDLYFICPSYTLLDGDNKFCEGNCTNSNSNKNCHLPLSNFTKIKNMKNYVSKWRDEVRDLFFKVDCIIAPSNYIKNIFNEIYKLDDIIVIEHGIDLKVNKINYYKIPDKNKSVKILFLGNIHSQKGLKKIKELHSIDKNSRLEFHFVGLVPEELSKIGTDYGKYDNENLPTIIEKIKPSFSGIFSICGESFSYTLSESRALKIPTLVSPLGAQKERVLKEGGGWLIDLENMENTYKLILSIIENPDEYGEKLTELDYIKLKSTKSMSYEYLKVYGEFL